MCQPYVDKLNQPILEIYKSCYDQFIYSFSGPVALNDLAINNALDNYFVVEDSDKLYFSLRVRNFVAMLLTKREESNKEKSK